MPRSGKKKRGAFFGFAERKKRKKLKRFTIRGKRKAARKNLQKEKNKSKNYRKKKIKKISRFAGIKKGAKKYGGFAAKKKDVSICQYARERKYIVCISTNGLYFNEVRF